MSREQTGAAHPSPGSRDRMPGSCPAFPSTHPRSRGTGIPARRAYLQVLPLKRAPGRLAWITPRPRQGDRVELVSGNPGTTPTERRPAAELLR